MSINRAPRRGRLERTPEFARALFEVHVEFAQPG